MVTDFLKILEAINTHGLIPALFALGTLLVLVFIGAIVKHILEKEDTKTEEPKERKGFFGWLRNRRYGQALEKIESKNVGAITAWAFKDSMIRIEMRNFLDGWEGNPKPSRIFYFAYHNSGHFVGGDSISKMSLRAQAVSKGAFLQEMSGERVRNILRADFPELLNRLVLQGRFYVSDIRTIKTDDPQFFSLLSQSSIASVYARQIENINKGEEPLGFVALGFSEVLSDDSGIPIVMDELVNILKGPLNLTEKQVKEELLVYQQTAKEES